MNKILIVDDEHGVRESLRLLLGDDYELVMAGDGRQALLRLDEKPGLVILDVKLPDLDGLEVLRRLRQLEPRLPVIMLSGVGRVRTVVEAMRAGAVDYLAKPFDSEALRVTVRKMFAFRAMSEEVDYLKSITAASRRPVMVGRSAVTERLREDIARFAVTASSVLISGESGTGKEVVARLIHYQGDRRDRPFVPVHCAAVPEALFESELFGYEKGAFTDATARKEGLLDLARDGTIFLDEIGEMPLATQVKMLRVLQEREYQRLGGTKFLRTGARVLAATARDLPEAVAAGRFRQDLYYRLNVLQVALPPLRERRGDIPELADYFFHLLRREIPARTEQLDPELVARLAAYGWPGNIRELRNIIERLLVLHGREKRLRPAHLDGCLAAPGREETLLPGDGVSLEEVLRAQEKRLISAALRRAGGVRSEAARLLRTTRRILVYRMQRLGLDGDGKN